MEHQPLRGLTEQLKAVAHPVRLRVLALVGAGELCVCQVAETLQAPTSSISEAIRELRRGGYLRERKEGRWLYVSVAPETEAPPFLPALLAEAMATPEAAQDRARAEAVRRLAIQDVCCKVQPGAGEASHG